MRKSAILTALLLIGTAPVFLLLRSERGPLATSTQASASTENECVATAPLVAPVALAPEGERVRPSSEATEAGGLPTSTGVERARGEEPSLAVAREESTIAGRVLDEHGSPVAGAGLSLLVPGLDYRVSYPFEGPSSTD